MTKYARIADGEVVEIVALDDDIEPTDVYHRDVAWTFVRATQEAQQGWLYSGGAFSPPPVPIVTKAMLKEQAANRRWQKEVGGIVFNDVPVATDDRSKQMILGARLAAIADPDWATKWVGSDGAVYPVNAGAIIAISDAVQAHVNQCFLTYAEIKELIDAETITTTSEIDAAFA